MDPATLTVKKKKGFSSKLTINTKNPQESLFRSQPVTVLVLPSTTVPLNLHREHTKTPPPLTSTFNNIPLKSAGLQSLQRLSEHADFTAGRANINTATLPNIAPEFTRNCNYPSSYKKKSLNITWNSSSSARNIPLSTNRLSFQGTDSYPPLSNEPFLSSFFKNSEILANPSLNSIASKATYEYTVLITNYYNSIVLDIKTIAESHVQLHSIISTSIACLDSKISHFDTTKSDISDNLDSIRALSSLDLSRISSKISTALAKIGCN
ncbi:hypothetical protein BB561_002394 [Smittium simulii]|uniref:BLOC-1-related complex subunit 5 n=1 Tax=Smittium simulii TaxID=133385 RepID=A0A2T9YQS8_9FUNG|nr:hypothetical protein BB561_002394 [Smittium simulii]